MFSPHSERELPLVQWTYELVLQGLASYELGLYERYLNRWSEVSRWRHPRKKQYWSRLAWESLDRYYVLQDLLKKETNGRSN